MKRRQSAVLLGFSFFFFSVSAHAESLDALSKKLAKGAASLKNKKIAVLAFPYHDGKISSGSTLISERLTTLMVDRKGVRVIERRLIEQLLAEKKLDETGIVSQENLKSIGTVLDVDAVVTGTLIDFDNGKTEINARMIRTDSGEVVSAGNETIARTWSDDPVMPRQEEPAVKFEKKPVKTESEARIAPRVPPAPAMSTGGKSLHLSNESFPEGRRIYHGKSPANSKKKFEDRSRQREEENYDNGYEEGYSEARRESAMSQPKKETPRPAPPPDRSIERPTKLSTVR